MARKKGKHFVGKVGKVNTRLYRGKEIMQTNPGKGKVKQTVATKKASGNFGKSSSLAAEIRQGLSPVINGYYDGEMISNFTGKMRAVIDQCYKKEEDAFAFEKNDFSVLTGFDFNSKSPLQKNMWHLPESTLKDNVLSINVPALKIGDELKFPRGTNLCRMVVCTSLYQLQKGMACQNFNIQTIDIREDQEATESHVFDFEIPAGCLCFTAFGLRFYSKGSETAVLANNKLFNPAALCAIYLNEGEFQMDKSSDWNHNTVARFN